MVRMTVDEVKERVRLQTGSNLELTNDHRITLKQALVPPETITIIERTVRGGKVKDREIGVWLVGQEDSSDGYKIIMRHDGLRFGLASMGFPADPFLILTGWYGGLQSAFMSM
jgi:hypothetical protein